MSGMDEIVDAAYTIGHRLRTQISDKRSALTVTFRLERVRGSKVSDFAEMTVARDVLDRMPDVMTEVWEGLARQLLGDELVSDILAAQRWLAEAARTGKAKVEMVGGASDGRCITVRPDAQGWPPPVLLAPTLTAAVSWTSDVSPMATSRVVEWAREVMNPETGVWRYASRGET